MKVTMVSIEIGSISTTPNLGKGIGRHRNNRISGNRPDYRIAQIGQNAQVSWILGKLIVTQTPMKYHQPTLM